MINLVDRTITWAAGRSGGRPLRVLVAYAAGPLLPPRDALASCEEFGMDTRMSLVPVTVAVDEDGTHEEFT